MNAEIVIALLSLAGTLIGSLSGVLAANRLTNYRIQELEKKVEKHNTMVERTFRLEEMMKVANNRLCDLERHEEQEWKQRKSNRKKERPATGVPFCVWGSAVEASCLTVHILNDNIVDTAQTGAVFQHLPGFVGMEVDFDQVFIPHRQQAVPLEMLLKIVVDFIFIQSFSFDEKLGVVFVFQHGFTSCPLAFKRGSPVNCRAPPPDSNTRQRRSK